MEPIKLTSIISAFFWIGLYIGIIVAVLSWGWMYGKEYLKNEMEYEALYKEIQNDIVAPPASFENYDKVNGKLIKLRLLRFKNKEKSDQLAINMRLKFENQWLSRKIEGHLKRGNLKYSSE